MIENLIELYQKSLSHQYAFEPPVQVSHFLDSAVFPQCSNRKEVADAVVAYLNCFTNSEHVELYLSDIALTEHQNSFGDPGLKEQTEVDENTYVISCNVFWKNTYDAGRHVQVGTAALSITAPIGPMVFIENRADVHISATFMIPRNGLNRNIPAWAMMTLLQGFSNLTEVLEMEADEAEVWHEDGLGPI